MRWPSSLAPRGVATAGPVTAVLVTVALGPLAACERSAGDGGAVPAMVSGSTFDSPSTAVFAGTTSGETSRPEGPHEGPGTTSHASHTSSSINDATLDRNPTAAPDVSPRAAQGTPLAVEESRRGAQGAGNRAGRSPERGAPSLKPAPPGSVAPGSLTSTPPRPITSHVQAGEGYRVYLELSGAPTATQPTAAAVHLIALAPFKSNDKYPFRFSVTASPGLTLASPSFSSANVSATETVLGIPLTPTRPGPASLAGTFSFSVCTPEKCLVERASLVLDFEVAANGVSAGSSP